LSDASFEMSLADWRDAALALERQVAGIVIGQDRAIRLMLISIFARGHVLLAGDVGVGKTTLLRVFARALGGDYERIEGTIDLMPADFLYHSYIADDGRPRVEPTGLLNKASDLSIFFFNEINRARPQVHSLLLRLMAERQLTAFNKTFSFPHLQVYADRNRIEKEETFELPAAARDRFFMEIGIEAPQDSDIRKQLIFDTRFYDVDSLILAVGKSGFDYRLLGKAAVKIQNSIHTSQAIQSYVLRLWEALVNPGKEGLKLGALDATNIIQGGASPRGFAALVQAARIRAWIMGRDMLVPEDVRDVFFPVVAHRVFLEPIYELRRDEILPELCEAVFAKVEAP